MANEFVARNGINIGTSTTTAILSDGTSIYIKSGGYTYLNTANSAYVSSGGSITATSFLSTYGTNNILLGNSSDMGANSFPFSIAAPSGTTVWPFGIIKAGSAIFRIDNNGNVNSAGSFTGTSGSFSSTMTLTNTATGAGYWTAYVTNGRTALSSLNAGTGYGIFYYQGTAGRDGVDSVDIAFNTTTAATSAVSIKNNGDVKISGNVTATSFSGTITSSQVTTALGFTPYNSTNPSGYITSSSLSSYLPLGGGTITGNIVSGDTSRNISTIGTYNSTKSQQIWSMGAAYLNSANGTTFGSLYGAAYKYSSSINSVVNAGGHQFVWCQNGVVTAALGDNIWTSGTVIATNFSGNWNGYTYSASGGGNTMVQRDGSGYISNNYFYTGGGGSERNTTGMSYFAGFNSSDYYIRSYTPAAVAAAISGQSMNISGNSASIDSNPNRTDVTAYPVVWSNTGATSPNYSCAAVTITSSSGTLQATTLRATSDVIAYYSDSRLKNNLGNITNALDKISKINGIYYTANELAGTFGYTQENVQVGVIAQEIQAIMPEVIKSAPFDTNDDGTSKSGENYITVQYEKIIPLLIEGIKEQKKIVDDQQKLIDDQQKQIDLILSKL